jgi:hypothetical protein
MNAETERLVRIRRAGNTPKATMETRVALIVAERGLTEKQVAKYFVRRRKNCKPRFDYWRFAKAQNISTDWLFDGDLRSHPRGPAPKALRSPPARAQSAQLQEFKEALGRLDEKHLQTLLDYVRILARADGGAA